MTSLHIPKKNVQENEKKGHFSEFSIIFSEKQKNIIAKKERKCAKTVHHFALFGVWLLTC